jgi:hypothetical protein
MVRSQPVAELLRYAKVMFVLLSRNDPIDPARRDEVEFNHSSVSTLLGGVLSGELLGCGLL